jgi:hypothetical protein
MLSIQMESPKMICKVKSMMSGELQSVKEVAVN